VELAPAPVSASKKAATSVTSDLAIFPSAEIEPFPAQGAVKERSLHSLASARLAPRFEGERNGSGSNSESEYSLDSPVSAHPAAQGVGSRGGQGDGVMLSSPALVPPAQESVGTGGVPRRTEKFVMTARATAPVTQESVEAGFAVKGAVAETGDRVSDDAVNPADVSVTAQNIAALDASLNQAQDAHSVQIVNASASNISSGPAMKSVSEQPTRIHAVNGSGLVKSRSTAAAVVVAQGSGNARVERSGAGRLDVVRSHSSSGGSSDSESDTVGDTQRGLRGAQVKKKMVIQRFKKKPSLMWLGLEKLHPSEGYVFDETAEEPVDIADSFFDFEGQLDAKLEIAANGDAKKRPSVSDLLKIHLFSHWLFTPDMRKAWTAKNKFPSSYEARKAMFVQTYGWSVIVVLQKLNACRWNGKTTLKAFNSKLTALESKYCQLKSMQYDQNTLVENFLNRIDDEILVERLRKYIQTRNNQGHEVTRLEIVNQADNEYQALISNNQPHSSLSDSENDDEQVGSDRDQDTSDVEASKNSHQEPDQEESDKEVPPRVSGQVSEMTGFDDVDPNAANESGPDRYHDLSDEELFPASDQAEAADQEESTHEADQEEAEETEPALDTYESDVRESMAQLSAAVATLRSIFHHDSMD
jgi:hypothetical protein